MWSRAKRSSMERQKTSAMPTIFVRLIKSYPRRWVMDCCIRCAEWEIKKKHQPSAKIHPSVIIWVAREWVTEIKIYLSRLMPLYKCRSERHELKRDDKPMGGAVAEVEHVRWGSSIVTRTEANYRNDNPNNGVIKSVSIEFQEMWFLNCLSRRLSTHGIFSW